MTSSAADAHPLSPVPPSSPARVEPFSQLVRRHLALVLSCALIGGLVAAVVATLTAGTSGAALLALRGDGESSQRQDVGTETGLLVSPPVLAAAAGRLGLGTEEVRERFSVENPGPTTWTVRYHAEDAAAADAGVQTVVDAYLERRRLQPDEASGFDVVTVAREPAGGFPWERLIIAAVVGEAAGLLAGLGVLARRHRRARRSEVTRAASGAAEGREAGVEAGGEATAAGPTTAAGRPRDALTLTEHWLTRPGPVPRILCLVPRGGSRGAGDGVMQHVGASTDALAAALSERGHRVVVLDARRDEGIDLARLASRGDGAARGAALRRRLPRADVVLVELATPGSTVGRAMEAQADGVLLLGGASAGTTTDTSARQPAELTLLDEPTAAPLPAPPTDGRPGRPGRPARPGRPGRGARLRNALREALVVVGVAVALSWLLKTFLVQPFYIPSESMERTLIVGDRILAEKVTLGGRDFSRGDVVVFADPGGWLEEADTRSASRRGLVRRGLESVGLLPSDTGNDLVKRVVGLPGDRVACCDQRGRVTVNGEPLAEPYLFPGDAPSETPFDARVPAGHLWVMGDHRSFSQDSRFHQDDPTGGFIPADLVVGRAVAIVWPFDRAGGVGGGR